MSTSSPAADRNLIFGLLALQMDFVSREQLLDAMNAWMLDKHTPLGDVLCRRGVLAEDERQVLNLALEKHIKRHGGDPQVSLAALPVGPELRQDLDRLNDPDLRASLAPGSPTRHVVATGSLVSAVTVAPLATAPAGMRYRRLREHARGGLGEVHVALDEELKREVALKEIQDRFADQPDSRARFLREAEITGKLEHPGVVPVYGLSCYPDGRPYYAMRFIRGESMQQAIARFHQADEQPRRDPGERSLALRELLTRFVAVCNTVAYAHSRGVIHRDLKPANAMLGEYGETLVVDWGLARLLDQPESEGTVAEQPLRLGSVGSTAATALGQVVGTPAYMPPEQAEGRLDRVGTASDVFALGATLYCLLTGQPPHRGPDVLDQARRGEVVPARQRKRSVPAALEAVCARAMAMRPEERYPTARALAQEVQRWLADEPVTAYQDPLAERVRRWGRRNRSVATAGVVLLLAGVVGLTLGLGAVAREEARTRDALEQSQENLHRAEKAEQLAQANLYLAGKAVNDCFKVTSNDPLFNQPRMEPARKLLLKTMLPFYKQIQARRPGDSALEREEAAQWFRVGLIEHALGHLPEARLAYERAGALSGKLVETHPEDPRHQKDLASTHLNRGLLLNEQGKHQEALEQWRLARDLQSNLVKAHPESPEYRGDLASTHNNTGTLLAQLGKFPEARKEYQQALDLQSKLVKTHPRVPAYQNALASSHHNLGYLLAELDLRQEALQQYQLARNLRTRLVKFHPEVTQYQCDLARTHNNLGLLLRQLRKYPEALKEHQLARDLRSKLLRDNPDVPEYQEERAVSHHSMGLLLAALNKRQEALEQYQQGRDLLVKLVRAYPDRPGYRERLAGIRNSLAQRLTDWHKFSEALEERQQARDLLVKLVKDRPDVLRNVNDLVGTHSRLGLLLIELRKLQEALKEYQQEHHLLVKLVKVHPDVPVYKINLAGTCCNLGSLLGATGKARQALDHYARAIELLHAVRQRQPDNPTAKVFLHNSHRGRAVLLTRRHRHHEAIADWDRVVELTPAAQRDFARLQRACSRARAGDYRRAALEADDLERAASLSAATLYGLAAIRTLNAASTARDPSRPLPEREKWAEQSARQALALLRRAAAAGHFRKPSAIPGLDRDMDLAWLANRDDFKSFRASLQPPPGKTIPPR
jgi:serine/threonine-protein kinase